MTYAMYDSINPAAIPTSAPAVAGYIDGLYGPNHFNLGSPVGWDAAGWARFPNSTHVRIACFSTTNDGVVGDCETGDMTIQGAISWVRMRRAAGVDPTIYMNANTWPSVRQAFQAAKVAEPHYWVANYDNVPVIPAGAIAKQYANATFTHANYDISIVSDGFLGGWIMGRVGDLDDSWLTELKGSWDKEFGTGGTNVTPNATVLQVLTAVNALNVKVDAVTKAIASLPAPLTQAQVDAKVEAAVAALPPAPAPSLWQVLKNTVWPSN